MPTLSTDPYAPPQAPSSPVEEPAEGRASGPLFSPGAIAAHTILFSPLVGGLMHARDCARLGESGRAWTVALAGVAVGVATWAVAFAFAGAHLGAVNLAIGAVVASLWNKPYRESYRRHLAAGGAKASPWLVTVPLVVLCALALWAALATT